MSPPFAAPSASASPTPALALSSIPWISANRFWRAFSCARPPDNTSCVNRNSSRSCWWRWRRKSWRSRCASNGRSGETFAGSPRSRIKMRCPARRGRQAGKSRRASSCSKPTGACPTPSASSWNGATTAWNGTKSPAGCRGALRRCARSWPAPSTASPQSWAWTRPDMTDSTDPLRSRGVRAEAARAEAARAEAARAGGDEPTQPILERLLEDQRDRCRRGEPFVVETYLEQQPSLRADPEAILDLIYNEMMLRESRGEKPGLDEYLRRFPSLADQLQMQFEVESALQAEGDGHADGLAADTWKGGRPPSDIGLPTPETDGGYELLEVLGRGGMGVVYKARQRSLNRLVALKMIRAHAAPDDLVRLRIEAEAIARLQHPNIVQIIEVGEMDGGPFLALEYVAGGSLAQQLNGKPWPAPRAAELTETLARAVHCAHEQGIVHRDLKPANILLRRKSDNRAPESETIARLETVKSDAAAMSSGPSTPDFEPKITDFGLAKLTVGNSAELTATGDFLGTPSYTAPEQAMGRVHAIGPATDVYALGAILYELLTGRPPFQGTSALDTLDQVRRQEPVPPSRLQSKLSRDLETICLKCLEKEPRKRYASALLLAEDLRRFQSGQPITARPVRWTERAWKWARRHPAGAGPIAVTALASPALALGGWLTAGALSRSANELKKSAEREHELRVKAEEHFARAVSAVEQMLTEVGDVDLADV